MCYTIAACFPFEPLEKCMTFKDIFPGLSGTKVIFQDFPGPGIFKKKSRTFQEAWEPCVSHTVCTHAGGPNIVGMLVPRPMAVHLEAGFSPPRAVLPCQLCSF